MWTSAVYKAGKVLIKISMRKEHVLQVITCIVTCVVYFMCSVYVLVSMCVVCACRCVCVVCVFVYV